MGSVSQCGSLSVFLVLDPCPGALFDAGELVPLMLHPTSLLGDEVRAFTAAPSPTSLNSLLFLSMLLTLLLQFLTLLLQF